MDLPLFVKISLFFLLFFFFFFLLSSSTFNSETSLPSKMPAAWSKRRGERRS